MRQTMSRDATTFHTSRATLDLEGNLLKQTVSRDATTPALVVLNQTYDILGRVIASNNPDSGSKLLWLDTASASQKIWEAAGTTEERSQSFSYDALRRPLQRSVTANGASFVAEATVYGESLADAKARNARGQAYSHKDGAGISTDSQRDFHSNVTESVRQLTLDVKVIPDWATFVAMGESFTTATSYDALGRVVQIDTPHNANVPASQVLPIYNEANLLNQVDVKLRGSATATTFVSNIDYDAKGQRQRIQYGNGSTTRYDHDPLTYRLTRLLTTRNSGADTLQDLDYTYDPSGNVVQITDAAQQTVFFNNAVVSPTALYEYDALYRLTKATGREHVSNGATTEPEAEGFNPAQALPGDGAALRNYTRQWSYDQVGNILSLIHTANAGSWNRSYTYATDSNRLSTTTVGQTTDSYSHNAFGSFTTMPHLDVLDWDHNEHLKSVKRGTSETWYVYDSAGQRVRKLTEKPGQSEERIYLGGFEIYRKSQSSAVTLERETLHIMDGVKRIALVETRTIGSDSSAAQTIRYQLDNHLQSATLELDESAALISYEEYYPYGDTSYQSGRNQAEVQRKRYRYTGKEKDEETGLYYHGARYYAPWLGRWTAADPAGMVDGACLYAYVRNHPTGLIDPDGREASPKHGRSTWQRDHRMDPSSAYGVPQTQYGFNSESHAHKPSHHVPSSSGIKSGSGDGEKSEHTGVTGRGTGETPHWGLGGVHSVSPDSISNVNPGKYGKDFGNSSDTVTATGRTGKEKGGNNGGTTEDLPSPNPIDIISAIFNKAARDAINKNATKELLDAKATQKRYANRSTSGAKKQYERASSAAAQAEHEIGTIEKAGAALSAVGKAVTLFQNIAKEKNYIENQGQYKFSMAGYLGLRTGGSLLGGDYGGPVLFAALRSLQIITSASGPEAIIIYAIGGLLGGIISEYIAAEFGTYSGLKPNDSWKAEKNAF